MNLMTKSERVSYAFIFVIIATVAWMGLATPLITVLFSYFALNKLNFGKNMRGLAVFLFLILVAAIFYGFVYFIQQAYGAFPKITNTAIHSIVKYANEYQINLPFEDVETFKDVVMESVTNWLKY